MLKRKIKREMWTDFLKMYATSAPSEKSGRKIMLTAIFAVLLIDALTICYLAIKNQTGDAELTEELLQMLLILILSSGVVGFKALKNKGKNKQTAVQDKKQKKTSFDRKKKGSNDNNINNIEKGEK